MKLDLASVKTLVDEVIEGAFVFAPIQELAQEVLRVPLLKDSKGREVMLDIMILEPEDLEVEIESSPVSLVQFYVGYPFEVPPEKFGEMVLLLNLFNQTAELSGFAILDELPFPFFRYTFLTKKGVLEEDPFLTLVGIIAAMVESNASILALLADGDKTFPEIVEKF